MATTGGSPCSIQVEPREGETAVVVGGEVDLACAPMLRDALTSVVRAAGTVGVVVDLGGVSYLDSTGVHCLLDVYAEATAAGLTFRVVRVQPQVLRVLMISGVTEVMLVEGEGEASA